MVLAQTVHLGTFMYFSSTLITKVILDDNGGQVALKDVSAANPFWVKDLLLALRATL